MNTRLGFRMPSYAPATRARLLRGLALAGLMLAGPPSGAQSTRDGAADRIRLEYRWDRTQALKDLAAGRLELLLSPFDTPLVRGLPAIDAARLLMVEVPRISLSLLVNPAPDASPWLARGSRSTASSRARIRRI